MALKIEIVGNNLVVTDTADSTVKLERPAADVYGICEADKFKIFTRSQRSDQLLSGGYANIVDSAGVALTKVTLTSFFRTSLGFNSAGASALTTISGIFNYGETLTAVAGSGWAFAGWKWKRDNLIIDGATNNTYKLTAADIGRIISVMPDNFPYTAAGKIVSYVGPDLLRFATPYNKIASGVVSATNGEKRLAGRLFRPIGSAHKRSLQVVLNNFYLSGVDQLTNPTSQLKIIGIYLEYNGVSKQVTWGGIGDPTLLGGQRNLKSDKLTPADFNLARFSRNINGYLRFECAVANGGVIPVSEGRETTSLSYQFDASANSTTNLSGTGSLQFTNGNPGSAFEPPFLVIGEDEVGAIDARAWMFAGNSIIAQGGDSSYLHTACRGDGTNYISGCSWAKVGATIYQANFNNAVLADFIKYANGFVDEYHTNSVDSIAVATMVAQSQLLYQNVRAAVMVHPLARDIVIGRAMLLNRTTDATGTVVRNNFDAGGKAEQLMTALAALVGQENGPDFYMAEMMDSPNMMRRGAGTKGVAGSDFYLLPAGTHNDGTHPNSVGASGTTGWGANARVYLVANA